MKNGGIKAKPTNIKTTVFSKYMDLKTIILLTLLLSNFYIIYLFRSINEKVFQKSFISKNLISQNPDKEGKAESIFKNPFQFKKIFA
jgi:hypothetical protein